MLSKNTDKPVIHLILNKTGSLLKEQKITSRTKIWVCNILSGQCRCHWILSAAVFFMTHLVVSVKKCCGCSAPLRWCGQSSRDLTVCGLTGRSLDPNPQYFARGNHSHSSETYRTKSVTMVPDEKRQTTKKRLLNDRAECFYCCTKNYCNYHCWLVTKGGN